MKSQRHYPLAISNCDVATTSKTRAPAINIHSSVHLIQQDSIDHPAHDHSREHLPITAATVIPATVPLLPLIGLAEHEWKWIAPGMTCDEPLPRSNPVED